MVQPMEMLLRGGRFKRLVELFFLEIKAKTGLKRIELEVLYFLYREQEHNTISDIHRFLQMNKGHISTAMDNLNKLGYVSSYHDPRDHRFVHYALTFPAQDIAKQISLAWEQMFCRLLSGIPESELQSFELVAQKIEKNLCLMLHETNENSDF